MMTQFVTTTLTFVEVMEMYKDPEQKTKERRERLDIIQHIARILHAYGEPPMKAHTFDSLWDMELEKMRNVYTEWKTSIRDQYHRRKNNSNQTNYGEED